MPLVSPASRSAAGGPGAVVLGGVVGDALLRDSVSTPTTRALADVRSALALIATDDEARRLRAATGPDPDPDGDLAGWLYGRWWCGLDGLDGPAALGAAALGAAAPGAAAPGAAPLRRTPPLGEPPGWKRPDAGWRRPRTGGWCWPPPGTRWWRRR